MSCAFVGPSLSTRDKHPATRVRHEAVPVQPMAPGHQGGRRKTSAGTRFLASPGGFHLIVVKTAICFQE